MLSPTLPLNAWYHLVAVYDGANISLWVNGQRVAQQADTHQTKTKDKPLRLGSRDPSGGRFTD